MILFMWRPSAWLGSYVRAGQSQNYTSRIWQISNVLTQSKTFISEKVAVKYCAVVLGSTQHLMYGLLSLQILNMPWVSSHAKEGTKEPLKSQPTLWPRTRSRILLMLCQRAFGSRRWTICDTTLTHRPSTQSRGKMAVLRTWQLHSLLVCSGTSSF